MINISLKLSLGFNWQGISTDSVNDFIAEQDNPLPELMMI